MGESITYFDNELMICDVKFLPKPSFHEGKGSFVTISPIFLSDCVVMGNLGEILSDILTNNFCQYFNLSQCPYRCDFYSRKDLYGSYVTSEKNDLFYDYYYNMDVVLKGNPELISFAYDVGLGNKNNQGFGMLELY
jgi:CRISPR-associated endoribonuclease Cas6